MDVTDQVLTFLKYSGAILAAVYGVYATVTDFHESRGGTKRLSKKGYVGIALLIVSSLLSFSTDVLKESRERKQASRANAELVAHYEKIIEDLKLVAGETARAANPIRDLRVSFCLQIPLQHTKLQDYRERLERDVPKLIQEGRVVVSTPMTDRGPVKEVPFNFESPLFPNQSESLALDLLSMLVLELNFYRAPRAETDRPGRGDLWIQLTDRYLKPPLEPAYRRAHFRYNIQARELLLCTGYDVTSEYPQTSTGKIVAVPDLANSQLSIAFVNVYSRAAASDLLDVRQGLEFDSLALAMSGGRGFQIRRQDLKKYENRSGLPTYVYTFPAVLDK